MRLEWLEDIVAIMDAGTLTRAAGVRRLTQPAFSRRVRTIEQHLGVDLIDRGHRPARLRQSILDQEDRLRSLVSGLRRLEHELRRSDASSRTRVVLASQHAITTSLVPSLLRHLPASITFRLRSANREECYGLVMMRQADIALCYQTPGDRFAAAEGLLEELDLGTERLVPVFSGAGRAALEAGCARHGLPLIAYPNTVFLGRRLEHDILPRLPGSLALVRRAETALTLAALQLAVAGVGVAWVPFSVAQPHVASGTLADLSDWLPSSLLHVAALRPELAGQHSTAEAVVWSGLKQFVGSDLACGLSVPGPPGLTGKRGASGTCRKSPATAAGPVVPGSARHSR